MELLLVLGIIALTAMLALLPRFLRAEIRGRKASVSMGHAPDGVPMPVGDGIRQIAIDGEITAKVIEAALRDEGLDVQLHSSSAGGFGGIASAYFLLYREENEGRVLEAIADVQQ